MLRGNKAIVTGGSKGIGFAIAKDLVNMGCEVVITGRNEATLLEAAKKLGDRTHPLVWDVTDLDGISTKLKEATEILDGLDILVNNAGVFYGESKECIYKVTVEEWERVIRTNASALFFMMRETVLYMEQNHIKGNILNITSVAGYRPVCGPYRASKTMASELTRGWGKMYAPTGIVINGIAPGPVATEMNHWKEGDSLECKIVPAGRYATCEEVSALAMHLLSKEAEMMRGEVVVIDGAYWIQ